MRKEEKSASAPSKTGLRPYSAPVLTAMGLLTIPRNKIFDAYATATGL